MEAGTLQGGGTTLSPVVFLVEEYSMWVLLDGLLPRMFPSLLLQCVPHDGKSDLEKSIPRRLRGWREPGVRFVVIRDNDRGDCMALKEHLRELCKDRPKENCLIRTACQELETWFSGDPGALAAAFQKESLRRIGSRPRSPGLSRSTRRFPEHVRWRAT